MQIQSIRAFVRSCVSLWDLSTFSRGFVCTFSFLLFNSLFFVFDAVASLFFRDCFSSLVSCMYLLLLAVPCALSTFVFVILFDVFA